MREVGRIEIASWQSSTSEVRGEVVLLMRRITVFASVLNSVKPAYRHRV